MKQVIALLFLIHTNYIMNAQVLQNHMELEELGARFDIPSGWTGQIQEDYILPGHKTIVGLMVLFENESKDTESLKNLAMQVLVDEGVGLRPKDDFKIVGNNKVEGMYESGFQSSWELGYAIGLLNELGSGVSIIVLTETDKFKDIRKKEANKTASSVKFFRPEENEQVTFWKNRIIGYKLKYMYSCHSLDANGGNVYSKTNIDIDLRPNGRFCNKYDDFASIDSSTTESAPSSTFDYAKKDNEGTFEIYVEADVPYLEPVADSGEERSYRLAITADDVPLLNDDKYVCRPFR